MSKIVIELIIMLRALFIFLISIPASAQNLIMDAESIDYLKALSDPVRKTLGLADKEIPFYLIQKNEVNAFVNQKDELYMFTGLIEKADDPSEVLGVLAHELGHIKGKHIFKTIRNHQNLGAPAIAGMLLGIGALATGSADAGVALISGTQAGIQTAALSYSREFEQQADQIALQALADEALPLTGFTTFMQKLSKENALFRKRVPEYLLTHPYSSSRAEFAADFVTRNQNEQTKQLNQDDFERVKAKLMAYRLQKEAVDRFKNNKTDAGKYGLAIGYAFSADKDKSIKLIDELIQKQPNNSYLYEFKALVLEDHGLLEEALIFIKKAHNLNPESNLIRLKYAKLLAQNNKHMQAITELLRLRQEQKNWSAIHYLLGVSYGKMNMLGLSHLSLAEEALMKKDLKNYRFHTEKAAKELEKESPAWQRFQLLKEEAKANKESN